MVQKRKIHQEVGKPSKACASGSLAKCAGQTGNCLRWFGLAYPDQNFRSIIFSHAPPVTGGTESDRSIKMRLCEQLSLTVERARNCCPFQQPTTGLKPERGTARDNRMATHCMPTLNRRLPIGGSTKEPQVPRDSLIFDLRRQSTTLCCCYARLGSELVKQYNWDT